jgi:hypothetical protein
MMDEEIQHCGDCKHWHRSPANVVGLANIRGQCRESPPAASPIYTVQGNQINMIGWTADYASLPPSQPACSRFVRRLEIETGES